MNVKDVNKQTIMNMLRTDVFGFSADDIESKAREAYDIVVNGAAPSNLRMVAGYGRNESGYIVLSRTELKSTEKTSKSKKKSN